MPGKEFRMSSLQPIGQTSSWLLLILANVLFATDYIAAKFLLQNLSVIIMCKSEDSVKQNLSNYVGESTSTFASEKGPPLADVERLEGNMRRELRNEKYPFHWTDFASPNLRIYTLLLPLVIGYIVSYGEKPTERPN